MKYRNKESNSSSGGVGLAGIVFVVFLVLKLAEIGVVAKWSWWYVTAPLWIGAGLGILVYTIAFFLL